MRRTNFRWQPLQKKPTAITALNNIVSFRFSHRIFQTKIWKAKQDHDLKVRLTWLVNTSYPRFIRFVYRFSWCCIGWSIKLGRTNIRRKRLLLNIQLPFKNDVFLMCIKVCILTIVLLPVMRRDEVFNLKVYTVHITNLCTFFCADNCIVFVFIFWIKSCNDFS